MDCPKIEELLSEYMESSLPDQEMIQVAAHIEKCPSCSILLREMHATLEQCRNYPVFEMDPNLLDNILLQTSRRSGRRSIKELWKGYLIKPFLTPRFAVGATLATLFLALMTNLVIPRLSSSLPGRSPSELFRAMNRNAQQIYGEGLKAYNRKIQLENQLAYFKSNMFGKLRFVIEKIDIPVDDSSKPIKSGGQKEKELKEKSSFLRFLPA